MSALPTCAGSHAPGSARPSQAGERGWGLPKSPSSTCWDGGCRAHESWDLCILPVLFLPRVPPLPFLLIILSLPDSSSPPFLLMILSLPLLLTLPPLPFLCSFS